MRRLAFFGLVVAMIAAAFLLDRRPDHVPGPTPAAPSPSQRRFFVPEPADTTGLGQTARRFLGAFLSRRDQVTRRIIRKTSAHRLARRLLQGAAPPPDHGRTLAPVIADLHITRLPHRPDLALVTGTARRPDGPEPFAFLFARPRGRWLAVAPAE